MSVKNPTEQYYGIMFRQTCQVLSKLRIGTKKSWLMHLVVLLRNQEWSIVSIKTGRLADGQEDEVWEARDNLVFSRFWICKIRHQDSGRSIRQDPFMNQEWYCTGKAVAQSVTVFKPRRARGDANLVFNRRSRKAIILHDSTLVGAVDQVVTFAGGVLFGRKPRLRPNRRRLVATKLTCASQANLTNFIQTSKRIPNFQYDEARLEVCKQINDDQRFDQESFTEERRKRRLLPCTTSRFRNSCSTIR